MACGSCNLTFGQSEVMALLMVKGQVVSAVHHNGGGKCLARALTRRPTAAVVVVRAVGGEVPPRYLDQAAAATHTGSVSRLHWGRKPSEAAG